MRAKTLIFRVLPSLLISGVFIAFSLRNTDANAIAASMAAAEATPIAGYLLILLVVHLVRTLRWQLLLEPLGKVGFRQVNSASAIGFMLLMTLPLRLGELARPVLISRSSAEGGARLPRSAALASCVVERIVDSLGIGLLGILSLHALATTGRAADFARHASYVVTAGFAVLCGVLVAAFVARERMLGLVERAVRPVSGWLANRAVGWLDAFMRGLDLGSPGRVLAVLALTVLHWALHVWGFYLVAQAFGLGLTVLMAATVLAAQVVGMMIPAGPGMVGTSQFFTQLGLSIFIPGALESPEVATRAAAYANTIWLLQFGQQVVLGLAFLVAEHISLAGLFDATARKEAPGAP